MMVNTKMFQKLKNLLFKYKHGLVLSYFFVYLIWFTALEKAVTINFHPVHMWLDDYIPFNEVFIIPYLLWFLYILITVVYFFFHSVEEFYRLCAYLFIGMTICLIIYTIWPNGHYLRVDLETLGRENIFTKIVAMIYRTDTPTNVLPSIHVFNSIGVHIAIHKNATLKKIPWLQKSSLLLTILICMSTVFLKQHSIVDVFAGIALNIIMYFIIFLPSWEAFPQDEKKTSHISY